MEKEVMEQTMQAEAEAPTMVFELGGTQYTVGIHFSQDSKETMTDKIKRMLRRDILEGAYMAS